MVIKNPEKIGELEKELSGGSSGGKGGGSLPKPACSYCAKPHKNPGGVRW